MEKASWIVMLAYGGVLFSITVLFIAFIVIPIAEAIVGMGVSMIQKAFALGLWLIIVFFIIDIIAVALLFMFAGLAEKVW